MRRAEIVAGAALLAVIASGGVACAAVMINSFQVRICVTGAKHPDGCKNAGADAHVVVSDATMDKFDGAVGQGATIAAVPEKGAVPSGDAPTRRRRQH